MITLNIINDNIDINTINVHMQIFKYLKWYW